MKKLLLFLLCLVSFAAAAVEPVVSKYTVPPYPMGSTQFCTLGKSITYVVTCDPGTRGPIDEIWNVRRAGVSICRARSIGCQDIAGFTGQERPDYEVRDAAPVEELIVVTWGLERLIGEWP